MTWKYRLIYEVNDNSEGVVIDYVHKISADHFLGRANHNKPSVTRGDTPAAPSTPVDGGASLSTGIRPSPGVR